ncbi:MAG: enoyl-CoA hydratase/isomerase family protein [Deltaproteobacteria bacterium]|nr:enoyl-CoA hydratase/isomerase family protein [Deltaproteobacteria bacterium]
MATVEFSVNNGICTIALNRPDKRNAINRELSDELDAAFVKAEADSGVKVVVLKGNGPAFCSGYDMKQSYYLHGTGDEPFEWTQQQATGLLKNLVEARYLRIWNCPKPTIAQVHGATLAAGCYLQLLCDISVAAEDASLGHPAVRWGGVSSMPLWQVALGPKRARYLLLTGRTISGKEAERIGLVSLAVPAGELETCVHQIATEIAAIPSEGVMHHKEVLNTDLEIMGVGAMFRYHATQNALGRYYRYR